MSIANKMNPTDDLCLSNIKFNHNRKKLISVDCHDKKNLSLMFYRKETTQGNFDLNEAFQLLFLFTLN